MPLVHYHAPCAWSTTDYQCIQGPLVPGPLPITMPPVPGPLPYPLVPGPLPCPLCMVHSPITNVYKGPFVPGPLPITMPLVHYHAPCAWSTTNYQCIQGPLAPGPLPFTMPHVPGPLPCPLCLVLLPITNAGIYITNAGF